MISIRDFGGIIGYIDKEDVLYSNGRAMAANSSNVDGESEKGILKGVKDNGASYTANSTAIPDVWDADWIDYEISGVSKRDLIYIDDDDDQLTAIEDFYAVETSRTLTDMATPIVVPSCIKSYNNTVQVGLGGTDTTLYAPLSVYRLLNDKQIFNGTHDLGATEPFSAGLKTTYGYCSNTLFTVNSLTANTGSDPKYFQANILYAYGVTCVFDGLQESNMQILTVSDAAAFETCSVEIRATNGYSTPENYDPRITAIKIYRAESTDLDTANLGLYRLTKTIDINDTGWTRDGATNNIHLTYTDSGELEGGATYEEETGIPQSLGVATVAKHYIHYGLNTVGGGYHWMTNASVPLAASNAEVDWNRYIFRSKKFRPNMVDWTTDFLVLPEIPIAMTYFQNKLYAFSNTKIYRIDPELLIIEDDFFGAGCSSQRGVTVTEYGMFFCNTNGAYWHDGQHVNTISDVIKTSTSGGRQWSTVLSSTVNYIVKYDATKRYILFIGSYAPEGTQVMCAWALYVPSLGDIPRWDWWDLGNVTVDANSGVFSGRDGENYLSNASQTVKLFGGATYRPTTWFSPEFHLEEPSQNKCWQMITYDARNGTGSSTVKYATEGSDPSAGTSVTSGNWLNVYKKTLQVYLATTGNAEIDSLDIIVRKLIGQR